MKKIKPQTLYFLIGAILIVLLLLTVAGAFYWYEYRPTKIRQECSWVQKHQDAISYQPEKTEQQLRAEGALADCTLPQRNVSGEIFDLNDFCVHRNKVIIDSNKEIQTQPAKDWTEKASTREYEFCIQSHGLTK
jgi:hypothetical protein